jgi:5'-nucleotidase
VTSVIPSRFRRLRTLPVLLAATMLLAACGDDDDAGAPSTETTVTSAPVATTEAPTTAAPAPTTTAAPATTTTEPATTTTAAPVVLRVLVSNDDGVTGPGLDALVEALLELDDIEVTVVAPLENRSGTGSSTTPGPLVVTETTLISGYEALAVNGFPADSVNYALDELLAEPPHLVVSGVNPGQNIGPFSELSGTVGAARAAALRGIPAVATSQGLADPQSFKAGIDVVIAWIAEHRAELVASDGPASSPVEVVTFNVATCPGDVHRGVVEVPTATDFADRDATAIDCDSTLEDPVDDVDAFLNGFAAMSLISAEPAAPAG